MTPTRSYELSFRDNTDPGTATLTVAGRGSYTGAKSVTFRIVRKDEPKPNPDNPKPNHDEVVVVISDGLN